MFDSNQPIQNNAKNDSPYEGWNIWTMNTESDVRRCGFFGAESEYVYTLSTTESLSLFSLHSGECVSKFGDVRIGLAAQAQRSIDYAVDCCFIDGRLFLVSGNNNGLLAVSHINQSDMQIVALMDTLDKFDYYHVHERDVNIKTTVENVNVQSEEPQNPSIDAASSSTPIFSFNSFQPAHHSAIRDVIWTMNSTLITAGEDGKICVWKK